MISTFLDPEIGCNAYLSTSPCLQKLMERVMNLNMLHSNNGVLCPYSVYSQYHFLPIYFIKRTEQSWAYSLRKPILYCNANKLWMLTKSLSCLYKILFFHSFFKHRVVSTVVIPNFVEIISTCLSEESSSAWKWIKWPLCTCSWGFHGTILKQVE